MLKKRTNENKSEENLFYADVVIVNNLELIQYAVAVWYDEYLQGPLVVAKGSNDLFIEIKKKAEENNIEVVVNSPLVKVLYTDVEIGQIIPENLYAAVAEILAGVLYIRQ